jgi:nitrogen regulatory protein P-II 1
MKPITAVIQPSRLESVKDLLKREGDGGLTLSEAKGVGRQWGRTEVYRGVEYAVNLIPKFRLEVAVEDEAVDEVIEAIITGPRSGMEGRIGDGKIFVIPLAAAVRIRTGETGAIAL